jgi:hypothetical protein
MKREGGSRERERGESKGEAKGEEGRGGEGVAVFGIKALLTFPSQPKIFPLPPITSNLSTHAWSIKCR